MHEAKRNTKSQIGSRTMRALFSAAALAAMLSACGGGSTGPAVAAPVISVPPVVAACARVPYWKSPLVTGETVLPLQGKQRYLLWQMTTEITQVKQLTTGVVYVYGRDYSVDQGALIIPAGSTIPLAPANFPQTPDPASPYLSSSVDKNGSGLRISDDYKHWQIAVTYRATPPAPIKAAVLPLYEAKLAAKGMPSITYFGDSITAGASSTPGNSFAEITAALLNGVATVRNKAVPGWSAANAKYNTDTLINDQVQDVVILGFGMNDAAGTDNEAQYKTNMAAIIGTIRLKAPKTEFILLSGMRGNPLWQPMRAEAFDGFRKALGELASEQPGIVVVDMTTVWDSIVTNRPYYDVAVNGVNHPGDFVHGIYADLLTQAMGPVACR